MKLHLFIRISITLVLGEITCSNTLSKSNSETSSLDDKNHPVPDSVSIYVIRNRCPENMRLYPRSGENITWACDCVTNFLYFPLTNSCHEVYRQGPCPQGQYVNLVMGEEVPRCTENPCSLDGLVPYNGSCHTLGMPNGPCGPYSYLSVNKTTYQVYCNHSFELIHTAVESADSGMAFLVEAPDIVPSLVPATCPKGMKRAKNGACRTVWSDDLQPASSF